VSQVHVALFLHAVETGLDHWSCRRGRGPAGEVACEHVGADEALAHLRMIAGGIEEAVSIVMHFGDGDVRQLETHEL
jgi:hypothetical protein